MKVWEDVGFNLDEDINAYLPFKVINPKTPDLPITARMLLTHTSSICDNWAILKSLYVWNIDSPIALGQFLKDYLTPGGAYYRQKSNFYDNKPGKAFHYSNVGATLAAYRVEAITGIPFDTYCNLEIFSPLGMEETSWRLADLDTSHMAMPYEYTRYAYSNNQGYLFSDPTDQSYGFVKAGITRFAPFSGIFNPGSSYETYGFYAYPDYPDGLLKTSAPQLARFLNMFIQYGELEGLKLGYLSKGDTSTKK